MKNYWKSKITEVLPEHPEGAFLKFLIGPVYKEAFWFEDMTIEITDAEANITTLNSQPAPFLDDAQRQVLTAAMPVNGSCETSL